MRRALVTCLAVLCLGAVSAAGATAATGDRAQVKAIAIKAVGGGQVTRVDQRSHGRGWEVYVRKAGQRWEVKISSALRVLKVERA